MMSTTYFFPSNFGTELVAVMLLPVWLFTLTVTFGASSEVSRFRFVHDEAPAVAAVVEDAP